MNEKEIEKMLTKLAAEWVSKYIELYQKVKLAGDPVPDDEVSIKEDFIEWTLSRL